MEFLPEYIQEYADRFTDPEPEYLYELNRETWQKVLFPRMLSGHYQGRVLSFLSKLIAPKRILEIGTYTGYSALCLAEGLKPDGKLISIEPDGEVLFYAKKYAQKAGLIDKIEFIQGNAVEILPTLSEIFDLVFIDAEKTEYEDYFLLVAEKICSGGLLIADNVLWSGKTANPEETDKQTEGLRRFNQRLFTDSRFEKVLLTIRDGLYCARKK
ncbi:MAG: O-methyltransferase [Bacteroidia bacterium]|nr:O-methyltransferase [Bacteroidia bacterium]